MLPLSHASKAEAGARYQLRGGCVSLSAAISLLCLRSPALYATSEVRVSKPQ